MRDNVKNTAILPMGGSRELCTPVRSINAKPAPGPAPRRPGKEGRAVTLLKGARGPLATRVLARTQTREVPELLYLEWILLMINNRN